MLWNILDIKPNTAEIFQNLPILAFLRHKNLRDIARTKLIKKGKVKRKFTNKIQGKCTPCLANNRTLCCKQIVHTVTLKSNQTNRIFHIYHNLNCKSKYVIYTCWNAPNVKYNTLEKQKLNSTLDLITTEKMYWNQKLYLQAAIFQAKIITSTHTQNSYRLSRYATSTSTRKKLKKD